jgi:dolichol-phosphate mannosyltransferase
VIIVALPAYNEEEALPPLLDAIKAVRDSEVPDLRVMVVDDGSKDSTPDVVRRYHKEHNWIDLVQHDGNKGLAQAIRTGFESALQVAKQDDIIITLDADNTQPPAVFPSMVKMIDSKAADVVVASRYRRGSKVYGVSGIRQLYSWGMSIIFQILLPVRGIRDYSCGFRAYRAGALERAYRAYGDQFITEQGFACMVEILLQLNHLKGIRFAEVPFVLHYDLKPTPTKMHVNRTIQDTLRLAATHRLRPPKINE